MKKISIFLQVICMAVLVASCSQSDSLEVNLVDVRVNILDLTITRATATEAKVSNIALKVLDGTTEVASVAQETGDTDFGTLSLRVPVGSYKFVAVANTKGSAATITSATEATIGTAGNVAVFTAVKDVTISGNTSQTVNMEMGKRKNTIFQIKITDTTPTDVAKLQLVVSPTSTAATSLAFSPTTGFASSQSRYEQTFTKSDTNEGTFTNVGPFKLIFLLTAAQKDLDITINALSSSDEVLYTRTLTGVTFKQGESTTATGTFFSSVESGSFSFDTAISNTDISLD